MYPLPQNDGVTETTTSKQQTHIGCLEDSVHVTSSIIVQSDSYIASHDYAVNVIIKCGFLHIEFRVIYNVFQNHLSNKFKNLPTWLLRREIFNHLFRRMTLSVSFFFNY